MENSKKATVPQKQPADRCAPVGGSAVNCEGFRLLLWLPLSAECAHVGVGVEDAPGFGMVLTMEAPVDVVISGAALAEAAVGQGDIRPSELCRAAVGFIQIDLCRKTWLRQVGNGQVGGTGEALEVCGAGCFGNAAPGSAAHAGGVGVGGLARGPGVGGVEGSAPGPLGIGNLPRLLTDYHCCVAVLSPEAVACKGGVVSQGADDRVEIVPGACIFRAVELPEIAGGPVQLPRAGLGDGHLACAGEVVVEVLVRHQRCARRRGLLVGGREWLAGGKRGGAAAWRARISIGVSVSFLGRGKRGGATAAAARR